jgi:hypothetical protein
MKLATAPVNWNNNDARDYRAWTPYPQLIEEMVAAGYSATEWGMNMPRDPQGHERRFAEVRSANARGICRPGTS